MNRRKAVIIALVAVAVLAATLIPTIILPRTAPARIVVIPLNGIISSEDSSWFSGSTITPELVREHLARAERDRTVRAIVIRIESPGGEIAACQEILWELERVGEAKPIVVSMGGIAASGGYYISTRADRIVALPSTVTGSIGVISQVVNVEGLLDKLGIEIETFKGGRYKDMYSGFRQLTAEEAEIMQAMIDEYYEHFVAVVAEGRGLSSEAVRALATGQVYTGTEAHALGLVDELGGLDTAIERAAELAGVEDPRVEYYRTRRASQWSLFGLARAVEMRLRGLSAQDMLLMEILSHSHPQPRFLYQG